MLCTPVFPIANAADCRVRLMPTPDVGAGVALMSSLEPLAALAMTRGSVPSASSWSSSLGRFLCTHAEPSSLSRVRLVPTVDVGAGVALTLSLEMLAALATTWGSLVLEVATSGL